jgi:hypothetical protein
MTDEQRALCNIHMDLIARNCVATARFLKTTPDALGLYVDQEQPYVWRIRAKHHTTTLPMGSGVLEWDTDTYPDVETAFQAALTQAWQARQHG